MISFFVHKGKRVKKTILLVLTVIFLSSTPVVPIKQAEACTICVACCSCSSTILTADTSLWISDWLAINTFIFTTFDVNHVIWWDLVFWQTQLLPAMMLMAEQLTAVGMQQLAIIGGFLDAKEQLETQRLFQQLHAKAHKDYHPSIGMCEFGSRIKSMAATDRKSEISALALSQRMEDRLFGSTNTTAAGGQHTDIRNRIQQYRTKFCDPRDNNNALGLLCTPAPPDLERYNSDIDYGGTLAFPWTVGMDLSDNALNNEEEEILALANNLYAVDVFFRPDPENLQNTHDGKLKGNQQGYMKMRSVAAQVSVAQNSFNALASMKASGTPGSYAFLEAYLLELGVPAAEIAGYLGTNPSYFAQMEILTKKAYQDPKFFMNLYDTPANVERKGAAIQAIGLIQKFDMFKSYLRTEASLSILLELAVQELQREIEDIIRTQDVSAKRG